MTATRYVDAPNSRIDIDGTPFAYREVGTAPGVPMILLNHLAAVLDNWDPRVVDGIAAKHRAIAFDNRGIGGSGGSTPDTIEAMARDAVVFIRALGFEKVDLLGFSLGGMVAQVIAKLEPPSDLSTIRQPLLVANGDHDRMVPTSNTVDLAKRLPNSELTIYPDAGHGGIFQFHDEFVAQALGFLAREAS